MPESGEMVTDTALLISDIMNLSASMPECAEEYAGALLSCEAGRRDFRTPPRLPSKPISRYASLQSSRCELQCNLHCNLPGPVSGGYETLAFARAIKSVDALEIYGSGGEQKVSMEDIKCLGFSGAEPASRQLAERDRELFENAKAELTGQQCAAIERMLTKTSSLHTVARQKLVALEEARRVRGSSLQS